MDAVSSHTTSLKPSKVRTGHLAWLDSLRALAALWVVVCHGAITVSFAPESPLAKLVSSIALNGHFAVTAFIAISGFSLSLSPSRNGWRLKDGYRAFVVSRWVRIVPPFYASALLSLLLIATVIGHKTGTHWDASVPVNAKGILGNFLLVQNFVGSPQINHSYWSVALEFQIYLVFGFVLWGMRRKALFGTLLVAALFSTIGLSLHFALRPLVARGAVNSDQFTLASYVLVFAFGVCACRISADMRSASRSLSAAFAGVAACLMLLACEIGSDVTRDVLFGFASGLLILVLATNDRLAQIFSFAPLAKLGAFSYSLYLTHAPMLQVVYVLGKVWQPQDTFGHAMLYLAVATPTCVGVAYLFHLACERPFFRLHHAIRARRAASSSD